MDLYQNFILEYQGQDNKFQQLDVDPRSDDDASLMSSERWCRQRGSCWDLLEQFQLFGLLSQNSYKSKFNFNFFFK